ncbi:MULTISPECIES: hypothetical protein [Streptomyces]|nr:hypothetical protein [Streptomyces nigrescens]MEE4418886.1 hypothetical protein [Streptomyces sp. DSM 41528]
MSAVFRGFTPAELAQFRHMCLRLVENQQRIEHYLRTGRPDQPASA